MTNDVRQEVMAVSEELMKRGVSMYHMYHRTGFHTSQPDTSPSQEPVQLFAICNLGNYDTAPTRFLILPNSWECLIIGLMGKLLWSICKQSAHV